MDYEAKMTEMLTRQATLEEQIKAAFKRIDEQKSLTESVHNIALSVERLTAAYANMAEKLATLSRDVDEIKERPARRWEAIVAAVISAVVGIALGYMFKR